LLTFATDVKTAFTALETSRTGDDVLKAIKKVASSKANFMAGYYVVMDKLRSWAIKSRMSGATAVKADLEKVGFTNMTVQANGEVTTKWSSDMPVAYDDSVRSQITLIKSRFSSFIKSFRRA
jgi:hypothetical protein